MLQQKPSTRGTMEDYREGKQEEIWVHKMKKQECLKSKVLEAEKLNVLHENINLFRGIKGQRKELKLRITSC
jgi:hypothetical protein